MKSKRKSKVADPMEKRGLFQRFADFLFGFDFFISYCWADGREYAVQLQKRLEERGFQCFLDSSDYAKGDNWRAAGRRALKKTSRLILVGTPKAVLSEPVANELRIFSELRRRVFPIDFGGALAGIGSKEGVFQYLDPDVLRVSEEETALEVGPSDEMITQIVDSFQLLRQDQKRTRWFAGLTLLFAVVAATAVWFYFDAADKARIAQENLSSGDFTLARVSLEAGRSNEALLHLWNAHENAPKGDWRKGSARRLIHSWLPYAGRTRRVGDIGSVVRLSPDGRWAIFSRVVDDHSSFTPLHFVNTQTGKVKQTVDSSEGESASSIFSSNLYAFSPDGSIFVLPGDGAVKVLQMDSPEGAGPFAEPFVLPAGCSGCVPRGNGEFLLMIENGTKVVLADAEGVKREFSMTEFHSPFSGSNLSISADGNRVLARSEFGYGHWEIDSGKSLPLNVENLNETHPSATNADGTIYSTEGRDEFGIWIVDARDGTLFRGDAGGMVRFDPVRPRLIARRAFHEEIYIESSFPGSHGYQNLVNTFVTERPIRDFTYSRDGEFLIAAGRDGAITTWEIPKTPEGFSNESVEEKGFSGDYQYSLNGPGDPLRVVRHTDGEIVSAVLQQYSNKPTAGFLMAVSEAGKATAVKGRVGSEEGLFLYNMESGTPVAPLVGADVSAIEKLFFNKSGSVLIGIFPGGFTVWDTKTGEAVFENEWEEWMDQFDIPGLEGSNRFVAGGSHKIEVWDVSDGLPVLITEIDLGESGPVLALEMPESGEQIAAIRGEHKNAISLWDAEGSLLRSIPVARGDGDIGEFRFSYLRRRIAVVKEMELYIHDSENGRIVHGPIRHDEGDGIGGLEFSPDGERVAVYVNEYDEGPVFTDVYQWDVRTGIQLGRAIRRYAYYPEIAYSRDSSQLFLLNMGIAPVELVESPGEWNPGGERIRLTLESLTALTIGEGGVRKPIGYGMLHLKEKQLADLGGPVVQIPQLPVHEDLREPESSNTHPEEENTGADAMGSDPVKDVILRWIRAGNSGFTPAESQAAFFTDPAVIDGKSIFREQLDGDQKTFARTFPTRLFTLQDYQRVSSEGEAAAQTVSVLQHVYLQGADGNERELEIRDEIVLVPDGESWLIQNRNRIDTHVIRSESGN